MTKLNDITAIRFSDILVAGALLTRLPLPHAPDAAFKRQAQATWSYPLIGLLIGAIGAAVWMICTALGLPPLINAGLTLAAITLSTGALHEDGLADTADGLWGGHDPARRLDIMKDSRIGSYGVLALIFATGLRWLALSAAGPLALIASATLSRGVLPLMMALNPFARADGLAQTVGQPSLTTALLALAISVAATWAAIGFPTMVLCTVLALAVSFALAAVARRKINGITGDILGATQQLVEIAVLLALLT